MVATTQGATRTAAAAAAQPLINDALALAAQTPLPGMAPIEQAALAQHTHRLMVLTH